MIQLWDLFNIFFYSILIPGLTRRARELVRHCRKAKLKVTLERLSPEEIEEWTRPKPKPKPKPPQALLQPWLQKSIANLSPDCTISLAPADSLHSWMRPGSKVQPSLVVLKPEVKISVMRKPVGGNLPHRSPPGLLPLITNAWSMQTLQTVRPKMTHQHLLPDLIPVQQNPNARPSNTTILRMSSAPSTKPAASFNRPGMGSSVKLINLVSSDEEDDAPASSMKPKTLANSQLGKQLNLPPGISITQVKRDPNGNQRCVPVNPGQVVIKTEQRSDSKKVSQWLGSNPAIRASPPALKFMGQPKRTSHQQEVARVKSALPALSMDTSLHVVRPIKLGKLPVEKREQMKQSLLKIQKKEGKTSPSSADEQTSPSMTERKIMQRTSPLSSIQLTPTKNPNNHLGQERNRELREKGRSLDHFANQMQVRRKRTSAESGCLDRDELSPGASSRKVPKLDRSPQSRHRENESKEMTQEDDDDYPAVIEVDLEGAEEETRDGSRGSSFGSLTPDSRNTKKRTEVTRLLEDECKELRRKGLEELPLDTNQRVTRCRTKSLPMTANKLM